MRKFTKIWKKRISKGRTGKCLGNDNPAKRKDVREKISSKLKGRNAYWLKGKPRKKETKQKISLAQKGIPRYYARGENNPMKKEEVRKKVSLAQKGVPRYYKRGKKNNFYKHGKSKEPYPLEWRKSLKEEIRKRDNHKCQICKKFGNCVHHIDRNKKNLNPLNLITLCHFHHSKIQHFQDNLQDYFLAINLNLKQMTSSIKDSSINLFFMVFHFTQRTNL